MRAEARREPGENLAVRQGRRVGSAALDADHRPFSEEPLMPAGRLPGPGRSAEELLDSVVASLDAFIGSASRFDDIRLLSVRRTQPA